MQSKIDTCERKKKFNCADKKDKICFANKFIS